MGMGILRELEVNRLRAHGPATLQTTRQLCTELIALKILPGCTADMLRTFMSDIEFVEESDDVRTSK